MNNFYLQWLDYIGEAEINIAENTIVNELRDFETFDPYTFGNFIHITDILLMYY
jgi:hypothetical protein